MPTLPHQQHTLLLILIFLGGMSHAQVPPEKPKLSQQVSYPHERHSVQFYLDDLRDKGLRLSYISNHIDVEKLIIPTKTTCTLAFFLKDIFRDQPLIVSESGEKIIISRNKDFKPKPEPKGDNTLYIFCNDLINPKSCRQK